MFGEEQSQNANKRGQNSRGILLSLIFLQWLVLLNVNFWRLILWFFSFLFYSKDLQFGVKFKPKPHSGWHDNEDYIEDVWVEELEPILECGSSITGYDVSES